MSSKTFIVGFTETTLGVESIVSSISEAIEGNNDTFSLINNMNQVAATVTSIVPVLRPVNIQTNILAATTTFAKIMVDWHDDEKKVDVDDVFNLVGNIAGLVGTVTFFAVGGGPVVFWAGAIGLAVAAIPVLWDSIQSLRNNFVKPVYDNLWSENPAADYNGFYIAPDGSPADRQTIKNNYGNRVRVVKVTPYGSFDSEADFDEVYPGESASDPGEDDEDPGDDYQCDEYQ